MKTESSNPVKNIEIIEVKGRTKTDDYNISNYKQSNDFKLKHLTLKEQITQILKQDKKARKDYFWLCLLVWIKQDAIKFIIPLEDFHKMYKPESISRICRELYQEARKGNKELKYLLYDEETLEKRDNLKNLNHDYYQEKNNSEVAKYVK